MIIKCPLRFQQFSTFGLTILFIWISFWWIDWIEVLTNGYLGELILLLLVLFLTYYHEFFHYIGANLLGYKATVNIKGKVCKIKGEMTPGDFVSIALSPLIIHIITVFIFYLLFPNEIFCVALLTYLYLLSCLGDIYMSIIVLLRSTDKGDTIEYNSNGIFMLHRQSP